MYIKRRFDMKIGNVLGYSFASFMLIVMAPIVQQYQLWSGYSNWTIPWLCSVLALSLLIVFLTSLLSGLEPSQFSIKLILSVYIPLVTVAAVGIVVDNLSQCTTYSDEIFFTSMAEWLGFALILLVMLLVPTKCAGKETSK